jgi:PAS domain S-box-containing protein
MKPNLWVQTGDSLLWTRDLFGGPAVLTMTNPETMKHRAGVVGVVGVGAAAGGAAALRGLLAGLPARNGCALVVPSSSIDEEGGLEGLGPSHSVLRVGGGVEVDPDRVYVSAGGLSLTGRHLQRAEILAGTGLDALLRSVSDAQGERSMAVVLSGQGTDGSVGIGAIRERGGLVLAQDPGEAAFASMPLSAIRSGLVDRVLPVARMPEILLRFARCSPRLPTTSPLSDSDVPHLERILGQVTRWTGGDLGRYAQSVVLGGLRRRMRLHGLEELSHYSRLVVERGTEPSLLLAEILFAVSRFFREPGLFRHLEHEVIPRIFSRRRPDDPVRVWAAGCGTGEEAYSVAMLLIERAASLSPPPPVEVLATDIHEPSLRRAEEGVYPEGIALDVGRERLSRFFIRVARGWEVGPALRRTVRFATHDLLKEPPPTRADLVLCRNLLVHLGPEHRAEASRRLREALDAGGVLLGMSPDWGRPVRAADWALEDLTRPELLQPVSAFTSAPGPLVSARPAPVSSAPAPPAPGLDGVAVLEGDQPPPPRRDRRRLRSLSGELVETRRRVAEAASGALATGDAELLRAVFGASAVQLELDACFCHVLEAGHLALAAQTGLPDEVAAALARVPVVGSILGRAVTLAQPVRIDLSSEGLSDESGSAARALGAFGLGAVVCRPVAIDGHIVATVAFGVRDPQRLGPRAMAWLGTVADLVAAGRRRLLAETALLARVDGERATNEQVLQQLPSAVLLAEAATGEIVFANFAADQMFGANLPRSAVDLSNWHPYHTDNRPYAPTELPLVRALKGEVVSGEEVCLKHHPSAVERGPSYFHVNAAPVRDASGVMKFAIMACADLTEQKRAEDALRELAATLEAKVEVRAAQVRRTEERFRTLVDASAQIVWSTDGRGTIVEDSPSWRGFTGQSLEDWLSDMWFEMVHPYDRESFRQQWEAAVRTITPIQTEIRLFHVVSQTWRWGHVRAVPHRDGDGHVQEWVGMISDVTARREAESDRERLGRLLLVAEQEERQRISRILHDDLQQILYGVMLKLRIVRREVQRQQDPTLLAHLEEARTWIGRAVDTTRQLTADLSPPTLRERGLLDALRWIGEQMRALHGLDVVLEADPTIDVGRETLQRLLFEVARELLFNIAKHAGVDRARVKLSRDGETVVLEVIDSGRGFSAERVAGFGLTTIRERLRLLGGRLEITCRPGEGTHARVFAPLGSEPDPSDNHRGESR